MILNETPQKPIIITGFPGFGLVGSITTEYLIEHLKVREIGTILTEDLPATVAIHKGKLMNPIGIYYNDEKNIMIIHSIIPINGLEWEITKKLEEIFKLTNPWRIINLEGIGVLDKPDSEKVYYYTKKEEIEKEIKGYERLNTGIIIGISSSMLLKLPSMPILNVFAPTQAHLPDSKAAASLIKFLDKYLNLSIDYNPLLKKAEEFEEKLKSILQQGSIVRKQADKKTLSYLG
jgi:uncharacterized protein